MPEGVPVLLILAQETLKRATGPLEVTSQVGQPTLLGESEWQVGGFLRIMLGQQEKILKGLIRLIDAVAGHGQLHEGGIEVGTSRHLGLFTVLDLLPDEIFQRLDRFLPFLLPEIGITDDEGQLREEDSLGLLGQERNGAGKSLVPLLGIMMDLGQSHLGGEKIGVFLGRLDEFLVGLCGLVSPVHQVEVLGLQETHVSGQRMVRKTSQRIDRGVEAVAVVLDLVQAGGPLGHDLRHLAELASAFDVS